MRFKGIFSNKSSSFQVFLLFCLMLLSYTIHSLVAFLIVFMFAEANFEFIKNQELYNPVYVNYLKLVQLFSTIGIFIVPSIIYSYLTNFDFNFRKINRQNIILVISIMLLITPFIALLLEWNKQINFPYWITQYDINSDSIIKAFLNINTLSELLFTLLVLAVVPAIGEELIFRGYLQKKIGLKIGNMHTSIIITSFIFSIVHLHFDGLIPRFILGILLGYFFYWGKSLWLPILAHFVNNAQAIILSYPNFGKNKYSIISNETVNTNTAFFCVIAVLLLLYIFKKNCKTIDKNQINL